MKYNWPAGSLLRAFQIIVGIVFQMGAFFCATAFALPNFYNVIFILSDDQGIWAMGCYGNREIRTPNLDAMAANGMRFTNAFATSAVCSPSRATLYTGRIPSQTGMHSALNRVEDFGPDAKYLLSDETAIYDILAQYGYTIGVAGKWHLGDSLHRQKSFDFWSVIPHGASDYNNAPMVMDGKVEITQGYLTDIITDQAVDFLKANHGRPFFLMVPYTAPHSPFAGHMAPEKYVDFYRDSSFDSVPEEGMHPWATTSARAEVKRKDDLAQYFAAITAMDENIGRILKYLKEAGLEERTLVIFASDQGYMLGHHGLWGKGEASHPKNLFDDSLRFPLLFYHSGQIAPGKTSDLMISQYDFLPTLLEYLGITYPGLEGAGPLPAFQGRNLPGRSFAPALKGQAMSWERAVYAEYGLARMIRTERWKYVHRYPNGPDELYDLQRDPRERKNLVEQPDSVPKVQELRRQLEDWFAKHSEPDKDPVRMGRDPTRQFQLLHRLKDPGFPPSKQ